MRTGSVLLLAFVLFALGVTGMSIDAQAQQRTLGPVLKIHTDPFDFDSVLCRMRRCIPITFENVGDTTLIVHNHDRLRRPFYTRIDTPIVLQPGEMLTFDLCYTPYEYSRDSQYVFLRADTRLPLSIAMVHDVSSSMYTLLPDGKRRYEAAHDASSQFIGNLLDTLDIVDEAAIYTYDYYQEFALKQWWTTDTAALRAAIPGRPLGTATCTYDALSRVIDSMSTREKMRVLIVVTDGEDSGEVTCGAANVQSVIKKAQDNNVRIYAITIGNIDRAPLIQIVKGTGGKEFNASRTTDLLAIYREIAVDMSKNVSLDIFLKGASVGPRMEFIPAAWEFDSVQVGETACQEVLVRNGGNTWLLADSVRKVFLPPYSISGLDIDSIAPFQTVTAEICFTPVVPLHYEVPMPYLPSPCEVFDDTLTASGNSFLLPRVPRKIPLLAVGDLPADFDTTFCRTTECVNLELHNGSDTTVTVHELGQVSPPFSLNTTAPFSIPPGETRSFTLCYYPPDAPRSDTLLLHFTADARVPQQIALLFDRGRAMDAEFMPALSRMLAAAAGANDFVAGLQFDSTFTDAVAVASFDSAGTFEASPGFLTDRDAVRSLLPDSAGTRDACVYEGLASMLDLFASAPDAPRSIMLFSAGEDAGTAVCGSADASSITDRALVLGTRIHCVQLGDADSTALAALAQATGGRYLRPQTLLDLILGLRDIEDNLSRNVRFERSVVAHGVTPILVADQDTLDFGATVYSDNGRDVVRALRVTNTGDAPMHLQRSAVAPPFSITSGPAREDPPINPGQSAILEYVFRPIAPGVYTDSLLLTHDGCGQEAVPVVLRARAVAAFDGAWVFPVAVASPPPLAFDTMSCGAEQCLDITFPASPDASTVLRITQPQPPFYSAQLPDSVRLGAGTALEGSVCYRPDGPGTHAQWLRFASDGRAALSAVFLLPADRSAADTLGEGLSFGEVSEALRDQFATRVLENLALPDRAAILSFDAGGTQEELTFNSSPEMFRNHDVTPMQSAPGDLAAALQAAMDYAADRGTDKGFVFAVVNEAVTIDAQAAAALRSRAQRDGVILAVAAVSAQGYNALAPAGDALGLDSCMTLAALQSFLHASTLQAMTRVKDSVLLTGTATAAELEAAPLALDYGTRRVGAQSCLPVTLRNSGNAPLTLLDVVNPDGPAPPGLPLTLAADDEVTLDICQSQSALRTQSGSVLLVFDGCGRDTLVLQTQSRGVDTLYVSTEGVFRGMPGSVVRIPVRVAGSLPGSYDVRSVDVTLTFDKTMLYPLEESIPGAGSLTEGWGRDMELSREWSDDNPRALARYRLTGETPLSMDIDNGVLFAPPFLVLHGSAMETPVIVTEAFFADGIPAAVIGRSGTFIADSLGFHAQRLIDASARYNASIVGSYPNPFNGAATVAYELRAPAALRLSVHDALGREVRVLAEGMHEAGTHRARFDAQGLPTGVYFYRLESGGTVLSGSMLYLK
ncbi:MAG: VWA domain-containing protein [Bacteroidota bacterium]|nr:VWA domain-containing protein [Bacteroidota bacterium]